MYTNTMRFTGLSGIDTESMVTQLMAAESVKYERLKAELQILEWQQNMYRDSITSIQSFQSTYFSMTSSSSIISASGLTGSSATTILDCNGNVSTAVSVSSNVTDKNFTITSATMAENLSMTSSEVNLSSVEGEAINFSEIQDGDTFKVSLDGTSKTITWNESDAYKNATNDEERLAALVDGLNAELKSAFGTEDGEAKVQVETVKVEGVETGALSFVTTPGHELKIYDTHSRTGTDDTSSTGSLTIDGFASSLFSGVAEGDDATLSVVINGETITATITAPTANFSDLAREDGESLEDYKTRYDAAFAAREVDQSFDDKYSSLYDESCMASALSNLNSAISDAGISGLSFTYASDGNGGCDLTFNSVNTIGTTITVGDVTLGGTTVSTAATLESTSSLTGFGFTNGQNDTFSASTTTMGDIAAANGTTISGTQTIDLNGTTVTFDENTTFAQFSSQLSGSGYSMSYDGISKQFSFKSDSEGASQNISDEATAALTDVFGFDESKTVEATDLKITINGVSTTRETNKFTYDGVTMTINEDIVKGVNDVTIKVEQDVDTTYQNIVDFVEAYNSLIDTIENLTNTNRPQTSTGGYYTPLTDDEKAAMSSDEIEKWEEQAMTGLLYNDSTLEKVLSDMRSYMYQSVPTSDGGSIAIYEIGITTSSDWTQGGRLVIDEDKLRTAIEERGDDVVDLFNQTSDTAYKTNTVNSTRMSTQGLAYRLDDILKSAVYNSESTLQAKAGVVGGLSENSNTLSSKITSKNADIASMLSYLIKKEESYYSQFSYMEQAVMNSNSQLSYLMSML